MKRGVLIFCFAMAATAVPGASGTSEAPYAFRQELERVHEPGLRDPAAVAGAGEFVFTNGCAVGDADLADFLAVSMDVKTVSDPSAKTAISGEIDARLPPRAYEIEVAADGVKLRGADVRALRRAYGRLERRMGLRGGPFLRPGTERRRPRFDVRLVNSGWRVDRYPDGYLDRIAHAGYDAVVVFLKGIGVTRADAGADIAGAAFAKDEAERPCAGDPVKDVIRRAAAHGLDTYLYSYVRAPVHPDDPDADAKFEAAYGKIAAAYPDARGLILVGESIQFPSKDPRTTLTGEKGKVPPGSFPCRDYPAWLEGLKRAVRRHAPEMEIVFWSYNWGWVDERDRLELLGNLPRDVTAMATFEMFEKAVRRNGFETRCDDYSLSFPHPGKYYLSEARAAKARGLRFFGMTCSAGVTWDLATVPCEPFPQLWRTRFGEIVASSERDGLAGILESHTMGWSPSFLSELANELYTEGGDDFDSTLAAIARRDYGAANAGRAVAAWARWSEAAKDMVPQVENQYGPLRIGPSYPFNFFGRHVRKAEFPQQRGCSGVLFCDLNYSEPLAYCRDSDGTEREFDAEVERSEKLQIELFGNLAKELAAGTDAFAEFEPSRQTPRQRRETARMTRLGRYWTCAMRTVVNVKRGFLAYRRGDRAEVGRIAAEEYANASEALKLVEADSRLGYEAAAGYVGGPEQIRWKLARMEGLYGLKQAQPEIAGRDSSK